jgi:pimeloyl-ACP methyl ester carboxylesterase
MNTYILVHGAWHGAWCWNKVVPLLLQAGHQAIAVDLPGHGKDKTPISEISLQSYVDRVCQVLDGQSEPVVLLGHSLGGISITQAAEYHPNKIKTLVYLCAFVPQNGQSCQELLQLTPNSAPLLMQNVTQSKDRSYSTVKEEALKEVFYNDCSEEDIARARLLLCPQAGAPSAARVTTTVENFGRIPKIYIETLQDKTIVPWFQEKMYSALPFQKIIKMRTSHSPFFSAPGELVAHLLSL